MNFFFDKILPIFGGVFLLVMFGGLAWLMFEAIFITGEFWNEVGYAILCLIGFGLFIALLQKTFGWK